MKIFGTGLTGLVGSRIVELLGNAHTFESGPAVGFDIRDKNAVETATAQSQAPVILHFAAKTNVDACELDRTAGENGEAWLINVEGTQNIVNAARKSHKKIIFISTDFVFDGQQEAYTESDTPNPVNWYGVTKYAGEKIVLEDEENCVVRITYPYAARNPDSRRDFVHVLGSRVVVGEQIAAVTDHFFTPTFIDDIAWALAAIINYNTSGIVHVVGSETLTPFTAAQKIATMLNKPITLIQPTTMNEFFKNRAPRPSKLHTKNDTITSLGVRMHTFTEGLEVIKKQGFTL